ncbi:hypothetical protein [Brevundimonas sp.]|uniref:hypothetical protein n=1 Tax=Brevundimonas sp. TaxID=1871086 RepID=UPI002FCA4352
MTDQSPTDLGTVWVTGQRRQSNGTFPSRGGGGGGSAGGPVQRELEEEEPEEPQGQIDPCADPETARIWSADAAAARAVAALAAKAASLNDGSNLSNREFGANLYLGAAGQVELTEIDVGPEAVVGEVPEVEILPHGTTYQNWMGDIHNHPSGDGRLSANERNQFNARIDRMLRDLPWRTEALALAAYVVVLDPSSPHGYRIFAHTRHTDADQLGKEVNPDAQPCPIL